MCARWLEINTISITEAKANLYQLVSDVNIGFNPVTIVSNKGKNAVLISENEWKDIEEKLFLSSTSKYVNNINNIRENENWELAKKYGKDEKW